MSRRVAVLPPHQNAENPPPRVPEQDRQLEVLIDDDTSGGNEKMSARSARI